MSKPVIGNDYLQAYQPQAAKIDPARNQRPSFSSLCLIRFLLLS